MLFLFLLIIGLTQQIHANEHDKHEMDYQGGTSVEPHYFLPEVNATFVRTSSETISANDDRDGQEERRTGISVVPATLSRVLDFYNTELLAANWAVRVRQQLSAQCQQTMDLYLEGLKEAANWALKMDDASGRYSTGWFWGNHYWAGSQSLCENISPQSKLHELFQKNSTRHQRRHVETMTTNIPTLQQGKSPSLAEGYTNTKFIYTSLPPFPVGFFMLRLSLNSTFTTEERIIHVGLCLPFNCTDGDARLVMEKTAKASKHVTINVEAVRSEHQRYNILKDSTFQILSVVTILVTILLIAGTGYDMYLQHLREEKKKHSLNCATYTNTTNLGDKAIKLDMSVSDLKTNNGKSGFYIVNNNNNNEQVVSDAEESPENIYHQLKLDKKFFVCLMRRLLLSFSLKVNVKNICDQSVGSDTIPVIHGLKSLSMAWVILGHTCIIAFKYSDNMEYRKVVQKEFFFQTISNGTFSVDTFFFTSGLLVSFLYFRTNAKGKLDTPLLKGSKGFITGFLHFVGLIVYRFARLTAPYLFILGVVEVCMKWFNYNSIFEPPTMDHINCPKYWWRNVLYINTLFPVEEMCMLWSWYLSDDTQFYIVGAVLLILATKHFKSAVSLSIIFMVSSWLTTGYIAYSNSHMPGADDPLALFDKIYNKPWTRLGPYLIGMSVGWVLFKTNCTIRMSKLAVAVGWLTCSACLLSIVYGLYDVNLSPIAGAAYSSLSHTAWALGLAWIVIACTTGYGGYVNSVLSATILYPFSRVTYCAYLLHPIVIRMMAMSMDQPLHLGKSVMITIFLGLVVASYAISFLVSVAFEAPVVSMLRILSRLAPNNEKKR